MNIFKFPFSFSILYINICNWDSNNVSDSGMFGLLYVYSTCPCLGLLALWLLAFFLVIAINQYGFLFPRHCDLGGALEGVGCFGGGVRALGLDHLAGGLRSLLWVVVALLRWHLVLVCLGRLSLGFALAPLHTLCESFFDFHSLDRLQCLSWRLLSLVCSIALGS